MIRSTRERGGQHRRTLAVAARVALPLAGLLSACRGAAPAATDSAIPVLVRPVSSLNRSDVVIVSGDIGTSRMENVGFQVAGRVVRVFPQEGQVVQAGEVIAQLDTTEYQMALNAALAQAREAEDQYHRAQQMHDQKGIPAADFVKVESGYQQAQAQLAMMRKHLADTRLVAPLAGSVARRGIEVGETAAPGYPVFTIVATNPAEVRVGVPEADIGRIRIGQTVEIRVPALNGRRFQGQVKVIGVAADPISRTYSVKIDVANAQQVLRPGMIAEARIQQDNRVNAITVPANAIVPDADGVTQVFVYRPSEKRVYARRVVVGTAYGAEVEVTSGLTSADTVVIGGQNRVREGSRVEVTSPTAGGVSTGGQSTP